MSSVRSYIQKVQALVAGDLGSGSPFERFRIPHTFGPSLTFPQALVAIAGAMSRIFLGSLLFAVWGTYSAVAWNAIKSPFWRALVALPLVLIFLVSLTALMIAISALVKMLSPKRR